MNTPYKTLADAASVTEDPRYGHGPAEVWYMRPEVFRDFSMGPAFLKQQGVLLPTPKTLPDTHIYVGNVDTHSPDTVWEMMQGEVWSPVGQARSFIQGLGLRHTSMSVGDIVKVNGTLHMIDGWGSKRIALRQKVIRLAHEQPNLRPHLLPLLKQA